MRISLRYKTTLLVAITQITLLGLLIVVNLSYGRRNLEDQLAAHARLTAQLTAASATEPLLADDPGRLHKLLEGVVNASRIHYATVTDRDGRLLAEAGAKIRSDATVEASHQIRIAGTPFGNVQLQVSRAETEAALAQTARFNVLIAGIEILLVAMISLTLGWFLTRSLAELTRGAEAIGRGNYRTRVKSDFDDEVGDVARCFNTMAETVERSLGELADSHKRFRDLADNTSDWLWETDLDGRYTYASNKVSALLGYPPGRVVGNRAFDLMDPEEAWRVERLFEQAKQERRAFYGIEFRARRDDGAVVTLEANGIPLFAPDGELTGFRGVTRDISRRKDDEARLLYLAEHDTLTGLASRNKFLSVLDDEIRLAEFSKLPLALLFIDLDGFKLLNDTHGHVAGDAVLRVTADVLGAQLGDQGMLARLGGDEFGMILRGADGAGADELARRLSAALAAARLSIGGRAIRISAGVGVASYPASAADGETLLARADIAMSHAKSAGHNRRHVYQASDPDIDSMRQTVDWRTRIHGALEAQRLRLVFQPILNVSGGEDMYYEALVRLEDESGIVHSAKDFIGTAELTGQVTAIDRWALSEVLRTLGEQSPPGGVIAMNLSGRSLGAPGFLDYFQEQVRRSCIDPARLMFEITESAAVSEMAKAEGSMAAMKKLGYRFSLDDFGAGFSSFSYLKHLPVDQIKIDGSFIRQLDRNREDQIFVRAILQLARELGLITVAEYVESAITLKLLVDMGIDYVQGFYVGEPVSSLTGVVYRPPRKARIKTVPLSRSAANRQA
jgi:diguanylate cyclase (GGDEF)-like protein/PAS domain S-box-containing protein